MSEIQIDITYGPASTDRHLKTIIVNVDEEPWKSRIDPDWKKKVEDAKKKAEHAEESMKLREQRKASRRN